MTGELPQQCADAAARSDMRWWWQRKKVDMDLEREVRSDVDLEEEEQRERGVPPEEAATPPGGPLATKPLSKN